MANVLNALDTSNCWSSDDSDEETHFREMVALSIQARRWDTSGAGADEHTGTPTGRGIGRGVDNVTDDDEAEAEPGRAGDTEAPAGAPAEHQDGEEEHGDEFAVFAERGETSFSPIEKHGNGDARSEKYDKQTSLTQVLANITSHGGGGCFEPAAPELVAALAALGIDVDLASGNGKSKMNGGTSALNDGNGFGAKKKFNAKRMPGHDRQDVFGPKSTHKFAPKTTHCGWTLPTRTGGGYALQVPLPGRAGTGKRSSITKKDTAAKNSRRLFVKHQEVLSLGDLSDSLHYGFWAHVWWSDTDDDVIAASYATSHAPPTPFPIGFCTRTRLVFEDLQKKNANTSYGKENTSNIEVLRGRSRWDGGRVVGVGVERGVEHKASTSARGTTKGVGPFGGRMTSTGVTEENEPSFVLECSVSEKRKGRPWEGPEFHARWITSSSGCGRTRHQSGSSTLRGIHASASQQHDVHGVGPTPAAAVEDMRAKVFTLRKPFPNDKRKPFGALPPPDVLFGFSCQPIADALQERAACGNCVVARLRAPHGVGLALMRVDTRDTDASSSSKAQTQFVKHTKGPPQWTSESGTFPLLSGYRVTFPVCLGRSASCEVVTRGGDENGVAFSVTIRDAGAVVKKASSKSSPDAAWQKLKLERTVLVNSGAVTTRLAMDNREQFLGGHLFGLESDAARRMVTRTAEAAKNNDCYLLAEPFLRDVYGVQSSGKVNKGVLRRDVSTNRVGGAILEGGEGILAEAGGTEYL